MKTTNVMEENLEEHVGTDECQPVKKKLKQAQLSFRAPSPANKKKRKLTEESGKRNSNETIVLDNGFKDEGGVEVAEKKPKISDEINSQQTDSENLVKNKKIKSNKTDVPSCENECNKKINKEEKENKPINEHSDEDKKVHKVQAVSSKVQCKSDDIEEQSQTSSLNEEKIMSSDVNAPTIDLTSSPLTKRNHDEVKVAEQVETSLKTPNRKKGLSPITSTSGSTKVRKLTPKQLQKQKELEEKRVEKARLKQEKERVREEKEKLREQQKQERIRLKNEKEDLKRREKEEKEKKRLAELEQKNEEKRIKEEERKAKEEERKAKEEEKKKKEEEKMAEKLKEEKTAAAFVSFFVQKRETKSIGLEIVEETELIVNKFIPFEVKRNMRVAPLTRVTLSEQNKVKLDECLKAQNDKVNCDCLYLHTLKSADYVPGSSPKSWPVSNDNVDEDDIIIIESEKVEGNEQVETKEKDEKKYGKHAKHMRAKLLQFHENRRPPYWGTWRKKSQHIRPRAPFSQDKAIFEYEVDSDDEWEEVEDGESLRGSDDEESQDENYEEDNVMFVPHGYLSDEEGQDEVDDTSPEAQKLKLKILQMEFEAERNEKQERIKPRLIGCVWFKNTDNDHEKVGSYIAEHLLSRRAVFDGELPITSCIDTCPPSPESSSPLQEAAPSGSKKRMVPETAMPMLIKFLHGNIYRRKFIINELCAQFKKQELKPLPSHNCIGDKIREIAEWMVCPASEGPPLAGKKCWYVKEDIRKQFSLADLNANQCSEWNYICEVPKQSPAVVREQPSPQTPSHTRITKFTKILSAEERKRLFPVNVSDNAVTPEKMGSQEMMCTPLPPTPLSDSKTATPVVKQKKRATLITVSPVQGTSRQMKNNSLQKFIKSPNTAGCDKKSSESSNEETKQKKRATFITVGPVQGRSRQVKNSTLQKFIKSPNTAGCDTKSSSEETKQKKRAALITVGPVQGMSRQVKNNNTLQKFIKSPNTVGCDKKPSETSNKDRRKHKSKADVSSEKKKDEECIVLSD